MDRPVRFLKLSLALLVLAASTSTRADPDLWGHLRFGLDTLSTHRLTAVDPYSFTQDTPWINHEWLSELQMGAAWTVGGVTGLTLLKGSLVFGAFLLVWTATRGVRLWVRGVLGLLLVIGTIHMWANLRPQLWTLVSFSLLCRILLADNRRLRWWLPVIFTVWVNCHGGWIVGLGVLGAWTAAAILTRQDDGLSWALVTTASVAATVINPYGFGLWTFMWRTVGFGRSIEEWQPLWAAPGLNWLPWGVAVGAAAWLMLRGPIDARRLQVSGALAMLAVAAARVQRIESLFVVASAILLAPSLRRTWPDRARQWPPVAARLASLTIATLACAVAVVIAWRTLRCIPVFGDWQPDVAVAARLEHAAPGRLVTSFNWGEYAIWHFGPGLRVSMDGRRETVYSDQRLAEYRAVVNGTSEGLTALSTWNPEYVWLPSDSRATKRWLVDHGYRIAIESAQSFLAVRSDLTLPVIFDSRSSPMRDPACFP